MSDRREQKIIAAFVALSRGLARHKDPLELPELLVSYCVDLLDVASAGLLLADSRGVLHVMAAATAGTRELEAFQAQRQEGPCQDCYSTGQPVWIDDLTQYRQRWPQFVPAALQAGFASVHAVPMHLHEQTLGALNLFGATTGSLNDQDLALAQALADVASVALVQNRTATDSDALNAQLQTALDSRVVLEQAKGVIAQTGNLDMAGAFAVLRKGARDRNVKIRDLARAVVTRDVLATTLLDDVQALTSPTGSA